MRPDYSRHRYTHQTYLHERNNASSHAESIKLSRNRTRNHARYCESTRIHFVNS